MPLLLSCFNFDLAPDVDGLDFLLALFESLGFEFWSDLVVFLDFGVFEFGLYCLGRNFEEILLFKAPFPFKLLIFPFPPALLLPLVLLLQLVLLKPFESFAFNSGVLGDDLLCFTLFLDLITSLFKEIGLGRPCSFRNKPHALHRTCPVSSLLHKGVFCVLQFLHVGVVIFCLVVVAPFDCVVVVVFAFGTMWSKSFFWVELSSFNESDDFVEGVICGGEEEADDWDGEPDFTRFAMLSFLVSMEDRFGCDNAGSGISCGCGREDTVAVTGSLMWSVFSFEDGTILV